MGIFPIPKTSIKFSSQAEKCWPNGLKFLSSWSHGTKPRFSSFFVQAIAMVELAALFHLDYFKRFDSSVDIQLRTEISGSTLGVLVPDEDLFGTISSFFDANEESLEAIITRAVMSQVRQF